MNESRVVRRYCVVCGEWFDIYLDAKKHWWHKRKMNEEKSGGWFFGNIPLSRIRSWMVLEGEGGFRYIHPWWKRPFLNLWYKIEDFLDPREMAEYWECHECIQSSTSSAKKED